MSFIQSDATNDKGGYLFKVIMVGEQGVGKSSILLQYTKKEFKTEYNVTIGVEFSSKNIDIEVGDEIQPLTIQIWDTAGQETFKSLVRSFYQKSAAAFMVYNVTKRDTFEALDEWLEEIRSNAHQDIIIVVIGNQVDQEHKREVQFEEGQKYVQERGLHLFFETSAKTNFNIDEAFQGISKEVYEKFIQFNKSMYSIRDGQTDDMQNTWDNMVDFTPQKEGSTFPNQSLIKSVSKSQDKIQQQTRTKSFQLTQKNYAQSTSGKSQNSNNYNQNNNNSSDQYYDEYSNSELNNNGSDNVNNNINVNEFRNSNNNSSKIKNGRSESIPLIKKKDNKKEKEGGKKKRCC